MTTGMLEGPPSSPTRYTSLMRRVPTIIHRYMVSIGSTLGCTPSQHDVQQTLTVQPSRHRPWEPIPETCWLWGVFFFLYLTPFLEKSH